MRYAVASLLLVAANAAWPSCLETVPRRAGGLPSGGSCSCPSGPKSIDAERRTADYLVTGRFVRYERVEATLSEEDAAASGLATREAFVAVIAVEAGWSATPIDTLRVAYWGPCDVYFIAPPAGGQGRYLISAQRGTPYRGAQLHRTWLEPMREGAGLTVRREAVPAEALARASACGPTRPVAEAATQLARLGPPVWPKR